MLEIGALEKLLDETAQAFTRDCSHSGKEFLLVIEMLLREEQEETMQSSEGEVSAPTIKSGILSRGTCGEREHVQASRFSHAHQE